MAPFQEVARVGLSVSKLNLESRTFRVKLGSHPFYTHLLSNYQQSHKVRACNIDSEPGYSRLQCLSCRHVVIRLPARAAGNGVGRKTLVIIASLIQTSVVREHPAM
jgi:hypothetical protein